MHLAGIFSRRQDERPEGGGGGGGGGGAFDEREIGSFGRRMEKAPGTDISFVIGAYCASYREVLSITTAVLEQPNTQHSPLHLLAIMHVFTN